MTTDPADVVNTLREQLTSARAELAEVRQQTAQRCAEIADKYRLQCLENAKLLHAQGAHRVADACDMKVEALAASFIAQEISREFALAEQPAQPQADDGERERLIGRLRNVSSQMHRRGIEQWVFDADTIDALLKLVKP